jgi:hypothetical protein
MFGTPDGEQWWFSAAVNQAADPFGAAARCDNRDCFSIRIDRSPELNLTNQLRERQWFERLSSDVSHWDDNRDSFSINN